MEWLFGSNKKNTKPNVYVSNVVSHEPTRPPYPLYPSLPSQACSPAPYPSSLPGYHAQYPSFPQHQQQYQQQFCVQQQRPATSLQKPVNLLESIPFKISPAVDSKSMPVNEYQLKSIKSQLDSVSDRINSDSYNYCFELERSVLREVNYR